MSQEKQVVSWCVPSELGSIRVVHGWFGTTAFTWYINPYRYSTVTARAGMLQVLDKFYTVTPSWKLAIR